MSSLHHKFAALLLAALAIGCAETQAPPAQKLSLPDEAKVVAEGPGELKFHVNADGRVFVYDVEDQTVEAARHVRAGQDFVLNPEGGNATLDGRKVIDHDINKDHTHRLCFLPE